MVLSVPNISNAARDIPQLFKPDLQKDEKILWSGQPEPQWFTAGDFFLIPFSLLWGGFAYFWEGSVLHLYLTNPKAGGALFMVFWGIPFVLIGSYFMFGRFFFQRLLQKNTFYALTNQRVIILSTFRGRSTQALFLDKLPGINKTVNKKGVGSLVFAEDALSARLGSGASASLSLTLNNRNRGALALAAFFNIKDVNKVYDLIAKQHNKS
jgi:hypothetical protein